MSCNLAHFEHQVHPLVSYEAAERAAGRIPDARLVSLETGGHLLLGQTDAIRQELARFLAPRVAT